MSDATARVPERPLSPSEASEYFEAQTGRPISDQCMRDWTQKHGIGRRIGGRYGRYLIDRRKLEAFINGEPLTSGAAS